MHEVTKRVASSFLSGATSLNPACWWKWGRKWYLANTLPSLPLLTKLPPTMMLCSPSKHGVEKSWAVEDSNTREKKTQQRVRSA